MLNFILLIIAAYLLGSIPFALIIAKAHGKDLRSIGSGNIGATNLARALNKKWAYFFFLLDALKGLLPMLAAVRFISAPPNIAELFLALAVGSAVIVGHIFPVYVKFKGGKGVAASLGVALGFFPYYTISAVIASAVWLAVVLLSRYISLASIAASVTFPFVLILTIILVPHWQFANLWPLLIAATVIPIMVIARHRANIERLRTGTENKIFT